MPSDLLQKLLSDFPTVAGIVGMVILVIYVLREYRKIRDENKEAIQQSVDAKLGGILSGVQTEIVRLEEMGKKLEGKIAAVEKTYDAFSSLVSQTTESVKSLSKSAEEKLEKLNREIPNVEDYSAKDILGLARQQEDPKAQAALCTRILDHPDATSEVFELAGDVMRKASRTSLAAKLYEKAFNIDPERISARVAMLCLQATYSPVDRSKHLDEAKSLALGAVTKDHFSTVANALIDLERYAELGEFCTTAIEKIGDGRPNLLAWAKRSLAISLNRAGSIEDSLRVYKEALALAPNDENVLKTYLGLLEETGNRDERLDISRKLIQLDPSDINYYLIHIDGLMATGKFDEAGMWLSFATKLSPNPIHKAMLITYGTRIEASKFLSKGANPAVQGTLRDEAAQRP